MPFVLTISQAQSGNYEVSLWSTMDEAYQEACSGIQEAISWWDVGSAPEDIKDEARKINDFVKTGKYQEAVDYWNDMADNVDSNNPIFYNVEERLVQSKPLPPTIFPDSYFLGEDEEEKDEIVATTIASIEPPYQASQPGATCRGASCSYYSPDAYADKRDGTFVCYQCKLLAKAFGGKVN
jgi:hypothetical protein